MTKIKLGSDLVLNTSFPGSFLSLDIFGYVFYLWLLLKVLHEIHRVDRLRVFKTIYKLMKKNSTLVIIDETMPIRKDPRISEYSLAIQTQYNEMTWGNVVPNAEEQDKLLSNSGFVNINRSNIGGILPYL